MASTFSVTTDDPAVHRALLDFLATYTRSGTATIASMASSVAQALPPAPVVAAAPPPPPAAAVAPPPPPPPPAAAAPPPPPPVAAAVAPPADPALMVAPEGWTIDHLKAAGKAYTTSRGTPAQMSEILAQFCPAGTARPGMKHVYPARYPEAYAALGGA